MRKKWLIVHIVLLLLLTALFPPVISAANTVEVTSSTVNVRSGPGLSYSVTGKLRQKENVDVLSEQDGWYEIKFGNETGWIASWLTASVNDAAAEGTAVSSVNKLNVRTQPSLSSPVITQMNAGDEATLIGQSGDWYEVEFQNARGFVSKQYVTVKSEGAAETSSAPAYTAASFEISVDALNIRQKPDLSSKKLGKATKGQVFNVLETNGNWVKVQLEDNKSGWMYSFYGNLSDKPVQEVKSSEDESVTVLVNGTNLRSQPSTSASVAGRLNAGTELPVTGISGEWYRVTHNGSEAWIASWVVTTEQQAVQEKTTAVRKAGTLNGVTIVLDPGHGGNDGGTVGARETVEKDLTLKTAETLAHHLRAAGAQVTLTRESDQYVDLRKRVSMSHQVGADAFISIHFDATDNQSVHGFTTYYMQDYQKELAEYVNSGLGKKISLKDRGTRHGNYLVLRENHQPAILVELGFLSNLNEERVLASNQFREQAALGLYTGIINYFDAQLKK